MWPAVTSFGVLARSAEWAGPIRIRRMFGGAGICDGMMFALVSDDTLYLKADDVNRGNFEARSLAPFRYETKGSRIAVMSYWRAPEELLDDPDELMVWARAALEAARRAQLNKAKRMRSG